MVIKLGKINFDKDIKYLLKYTKKMIKVRFTQLRAKLKSFNH